ncbi:MAG: arsenic resistance protein [Candidatus Izimaplasma sp.]|nr:arsenic resistance protein [Candidatus Izimaplasma bacterium]
MKLLLLIKKHLIVSILLSMILGLIVGHYFDTSWLKNLIIPLTFVLVYPMMVTLNFNSLKQKSNIKLQLTTQLINFIVFPAIAFGLGYFFFQGLPYLRLGLLLIALLPTSGMTISWTVMAKGNINEALRMVIIGLLLGAILSPFYITFMLGSEVSVPIMAIMLQIVVVVFVPLFFAFITQKLIVKKHGKEKFNKKIKPVFPLFSTLGIVLMIFTAISLKASVLINNPMILLDIMIPLVLLYASYFLISVFAARLFFNRADGIALVNGTLIRNLSLSLAITLSVFPEAGIAALLIAIAYVLQVQIAAWNAKLSKIVFKPE